MYILGISCFYHDSAACLVSDGTILAAAQEERFSRKKHDFDFPEQAIKYCLQEAGIRAADLDYVAFYDKPFLKFERILESYLAYAPKGISSFLMAMPLWLKQKLWLPDIISRKLDYHGKILFTEHHESHAASAFFPSPFGEAAFITLDGVGEWATTSIGIGRENKIDILKEIHFPHSLGLLYSAFTYYTGFRVNSGEYKVMGLAPYGEPRYVDTIFKHLLDLKEDGSFRLNMDYFNYGAGLTMTNRKFDALFGGPPRKPESPLDQRHMDVARSLQEVTEEVMLRVANHAHQLTGQKNLCLAGGVALNCVGNGRILRESRFSEIWIQPAAGDAGGALGAALHVWYKVLGHPRVNDEKKDSQRGSYLGPAFGDEEIRSFLDENEIEYQYLNEEELFPQVAEWLDRGKVIGWFQGRMEFGPRALGNRSILGDARSPKMQSVMNLKIKYRESFRPFAPSVLEEKVGEYFNLNRSSPYMLLVADVKPEKRLPLAEEDHKKSGLAKLECRRSQVPAVTHVDYSARIQTVNQKDNPRYYRLIKTFEERTGCPVLINTSFNVRGEPIVCTPQEAYRCFMNTEMDVLVLGNQIVVKEDAESRPTQMARQGAYALD